MNTYISINIKTQTVRYTQEYYLAIKKKEIMLLAITQLEGTVLSETNQTDKYRSSSIYNGVMSQ